MRSSGISRRIKLDREPERMNGRSTIEAVKSAERLILINLRSITDLEGKRERRERVNTTKGRKRIT